jgi:Rps23 Pro-64 3,4-dihydroxylase Tpa1-like proline 4-hydroxylase
MIQVYKNFITPQDQLIINETIMQPIWQWGHGSAPNGQNTFWKIDNLQNNKFYSVNLLNKIKELTSDQLQIERIYMNGHTACSHANIHKDSESNNGRTFLIYCNQIWNPEFGGGTCFVKDDEIMSIYPYPYSAVYFQNNINHFSMPLSKNFNGLRVTLAYKLHKIQ